MKKQKPTTAKEILDGYKQIQEIEQSTASYFDYDLPKEKQEYIDEVEKFFKKFEGQKIKLTKKLKKQTEELIINYCMMKCYKHSNVSSILHRLMLRENQSKTIKDFCELNGIDYEVCYLHGSMKFDLCRTLDILIHSKNENKELLEKHLTNSKN
jgi:hypothetical protein